eukprot:Amastigsp_a678030_238.p4 type:complete len:168 gc:universal Amastigsp_a678030_238:963-460(-)
MPVSLVISRSVWRSFMSWPETQIALPFWPWVFTCVGVIAPKFEVCALSSIAITCTFVAPISSASPRSASTDCLGASSIVSLESARWIVACTALSSKPSCDACSAYAQTPLIPYVQSSTIDDWSMLPIVSRRASTPYAWPCSTRSPLRSTFCGSGASGFWPAVKAAFS